MSRLFCFSFVGVIVIFLLFPMRSEAQVLRYRFQPGEHIQYHWKENFEYDQMRNRGSHQFTSEQEADPEFIVKRVDERGGALMDVAVRNRYLKLKQRKDRLTYTSLIPATEMFLTSEGRFLTGKIYIDDTLRTLTKKLINLVPEVGLLTDNELLFWTARRLWFPLDSLPADKNSFTITRNFDTAINRRIETTVWVKSQYQPVITVRDWRSNHSGTTTYTLGDTTVEDATYSHLHYVTTSVIGSSHWSATFHKEGQDNTGSVTEIIGDVLFRKADGIPYLWRYSTEQHNGGKFASFSESESKLQKIEIGH